MESSYWNSDSDWTQSSFTSNFDNYQKQLKQILIEKNKQREL